MSQKRKCSQRSNSTVSINLYCDKGRKLHCFYQFSPEGCKKNTDLERGLDYSPREVTTATTRRLQLLPRDA